MQSFANGSDPERKARMGTSTSCAWLQNFELHPSLTHRQKIEVQQRNHTIMLEQDVASPIITVDELSR